VAILEDDQVVEVYHQRENEYSLAGSIHKGRVTRVLPGMQSAFVDIGLERDAFLYVSDFFEDNEEYDKIVTSVEEKVLKLDRAPQAQTAVAVPAPETAAEPITVPVNGAESASASAVAPASSAPAVEPRGERRDERERDRRGRRGRRRRGQKGGRGLPESKFYSPRAEGEAQVQEQEEAEPTDTAAAADEFLVLPGESLAKYGHADVAEEPQAAADESGTETEPEESSEAAIDSEPAIEGRAEFHEEPAETIPSEIAAEPPAEPQPELAFAVEAAVEEKFAGAMEAEPEPEPEPEIAEDVDMVPADAAEPAEAADADTEAAEALAPAAGEEPAAEESVAAPEGDIEAAGGAGTEAAAVPQDEGPEPARIPTSLTATLREQGGRYPHRVSRRMRRKQRESRGAAPEGARPQEGRQEQREVSAERRDRPEPREPREQKEQRAEQREQRSAPSISDLLKEGQEIIVQIAKEPLGQKGARITSHIALPGRFLVYMPTVEHVGVSRKIPSEEERSRLKRILQTHRAGIPGGFIVRTAGEGRTEEELRADMMFLYNLWLDMRQKAERKPAPMLIHHDLNVVERVLRDQLTSAFKSIWVDNEELYESVLRFVQRFQPALVGRVKMYTRSNPIFDEFGITAELEKALRPKVWLKSGGYIVINQTEALVAIDVNTGKYVGKSNRLEDTIVKTNTDAIREIVRQIRLRDLGGIIVVDFIDMDERKNRQKVMQALEEAMRADRAPYKILQFNDFGLVAITRKRVKQSLERTLCTPCPYCEGAGYVKSPQTVVGEILQEAHKIVKALEGKDVMLRVAPDVAKLLKSNQNTYLQELEEILGRTVIVKSDNQLHQEKFDLA
jgi:ribonuclease G